MPELYSQAFYQPLLHAYKEAPQQEVVSLKVESEQQLKAFLRNKLCYLFDYDALNNAFRKRSIQGPAEREASITVNQFMDYVSVRLLVINHLFADKINHADNSCNKVFFK